MSECEVVAGSEMSRNDKVRVIVIGDSKVGKTSMLYRLKVKNGELPNTTSTIGVDFHTITMQVNGAPVDFQLWDTAGQENFRSITKSYFRNAAAGYLLFDLTRRESFDHLSRWISEAHNNCQRRQGITLLLVGNKADLVEQRQVTYDDAEDFAKQHNMTYVETSAKSGANIQEALQRLVEIVTEQEELAEVRNLDGDVIDPADDLNITSSLASQSFSPAPATMTTEYDTKIENEKRRCCMK